MLGISISLTVLVVVAGTPFVAGLFAMGDLSTDQAWLLGITVATYALSFPFAALQRMLLGVSFAGLDTGTYLRNTIFGALVNIVILFALYFFWQPRLEILIVPIAYGVAQAVNVWHAAVVVRHDVGPPFAGVSRGGLRFAVVLLATLAAMLIVLIPLSRGLTGSPVSLVAAGIASALVGMLTLAAGSRWVAPSEVRGFLKRRQTPPVTSPANRADD
jgi:peptidoglycan biosynthesis protein MviN/MurJ (putative lipid II flippase)